METITLVQRLGGALACAALAVVFWGIWRGSRRQVGRTTGQMGPFLRSPWFYLVASTVFFAISWFCWIPLPVAFSPHTRVWMLVFGSLLYFPGISMVLWGRLALGKFYFVSTGLGAQLFAGHQLITTGPFAFVRHPMYSGLILAAFGSLLIYTTWTTLLFTCFAPFLVFRARREETVLAAEFGAQWLAYCRRVPAFLPRFGKER